MTDVLLHMLDALSIGVLFAATLAASILLARIMSGKGPSRSLSWHWIGALMVAFTATVFAFNIINLVTRTQ